MAGRPLQRPPRMLQPHQMKTYAMARPLQWWVFMDCATYGCTAYMNGWTTVLPAGSDLLDVARRSGRRFTETHGDDGLISFAFEPGQQCFHAPWPDAVGRPVLEVTTRLMAEGRPEVADRWHKGMATEREPMFAVVEGDDRGNPRGIPPRVLRPDQWLDDFGSHQDQLADRVKRG